MPRRMIVRPRSAGVAVTTQSAGDVRGADQGC